MAKSFSTTTATMTLKADAAGHAQAVFTVTNATPRPIRGMARARALGDTKREWLSVAGETERDFGGGTTEQFTVNFDAAGAPAGKYPFRLDVSSARNPDEDFTEGPTVTVEVAGAPPPPPPPPPKKWWIIFVIIGGVVLIGIIILIVVLVGNGKKPPQEVTPTPTATATEPPAPATPTPTTTEFRVIGTTLTANPVNYVGPCPAKITFSGSITANQPGRVKYTFIRSDGAIDTRDLSLDFDGPGSKPVETTWTLGAAVPTFQPFRGFQSIKILSPNEMESNKAEFVLNCPEGTIRDHRRVEGTIRDHRTVEGTIRDHRRPR
jgi:hypothetical protein